MGLYDTIIKYKRLHSKMLLFTPELHQRCGVGDDDRRKSRHSPVA